jgi:hypothetical protein
MPLNMPAANMANTVYSGNTGVAHNTINSGGIQSSQLFANASSGNVNSTMWSTVSVPEYGDITIGSASLKEFMKTVSERLLILTPDPKKLEKHEALRKAYENYKLLEKLVNED